MLDVMRDGQQPMPVDEAEWLAGYRKQLAGLMRWQGPRPDLDAFTNDCPGGDGAPRTLRLLRPPGPGPWPTVLFIHGGGFVAGVLDAYDIPLRHLALRSGWQVAAIDYRLAPEHPYPAAPDDCITALRFLAGEPHATRLAVAGDSAGGLLACVTARRARAAGIAVARQILLYPNADLREGPLYDSRPAFDGTVIRLAELYRSLALYAGPVARTDPDLSPVFADPSGLPATLLVTNECDPLRDEGDTLGDRLSAAGVSVERHRVPGMIHGALQYAAAVPAGDALISMVAEALIATQS